MRGVLHRLAIGAMLMAPLSAYAEEPSILNPSGLPVPRFVALKSDYVNARVGPGKRYPITWVYKRKLLPVSIVEEFANWRKIRDNDGEGGWVHKSLLSGTRTAIVQDGPQHLYSRPDATSRPVAKLGEKVIIELVRCSPDWCEAQTGDYDGWIRKADIWGVSREETFED